MTLLVGATSIVVAVMLSIIGWWEASRGAARSRAQIAADAAALAAVAESTSIGRGVHYFEARRFAEANGGELISCLCYRGATAVQVEVRVAGQRATARAEFDADLLMPSPGALNGLDPVLARAVSDLVSGSDGAIHVVSGFRTAAMQGRLWRDAVRRHGDPDAADDWVAPPGRSMHEMGLAVDLGGDLELAVSLIQELGLPLHRPLGNEPWHFELSGSRGPNAV